MCWLQTDAFQSHNAFCESIQLANNSSCFSHTAAESKSCKLDFFVQYESVFSEALSDAQAVLNRLEECREIDTSQKEVGVFTSTNHASFFFTLLRAPIVCALFRKLFHGKLVPGCLKGNVCNTLERSICKCKLLRHAGKEVCPALKTSLCCRRAPAHISLLLFMAFASGIVSTCKRLTYEIPK